eukprot:TRINITY_DN21250_c0_g1_i1.p1 TRINITY_DN21250_c0_g1~~TRINITY_DN21250_c0_g1_i1.p1  ORF type:complete len:254 (-),score=58.54 TRINITY_DN21250_c0_g1_i1:215-976(-)
MFQTRSEYDQGVNTFSPEGRIHQLEYALEASKLGSTAVAIQTVEGVVIAVEKRIPSILMEPASLEKIMKLDTHCGCASSGLSADARTLVDHMRVQTQNHIFSFNEKMGIEAITLCGADHCIRFGDDGDDDGDGKGMSRPFGVGMLIGGVDENGPQLFHIDPSGTYDKYKAKAIGAGSEAAMTALQDGYDEKMSLRKATVFALSILKEVMEEKLTVRNVEVGHVLVEKPKFEILTHPDLVGLFEDLEAVTAEED